MDSGKRGVIRNVSKGTDDLLLANEKTREEFLELVEENPFSLREMEKALSQAQYWKVFEKAVKVAKVMNDSVVRCAAMLSILNRRKK